MGKRKPSRAVAEARSPDQVAADNPQHALFRALDFYPTPPWAARALGEMVRKLDPEARTCWEPACGEGHMAEPLEAYFDQVRASDIHPFGFGEVLDFLLDDACRLGEKPADWIITNPPFKHAAEFTRRALARSRRGVVMLCRLAFMESLDRYELLYGATPVSFVMPFAERVPMQLGLWNPKGSTASAYAAFVWLHGHTGPSEVRPIPPGCATRLTRPLDARRFGKPAANPLFGGGA